MIDMITTLSSFFSALWAARSWRGRRSFDAWQKGKLDAWLKQDLPKVSYYREGAKDISCLPIVDKAMMMNAFAEFNTLGMSGDQAWALINSQRQLEGYVVGASTGTSGNRGVFVISDAERFVWLGSILAKALPQFLWQRQRVAVILPRNTGLYDSARQTGRIDLRFFDLGMGAESWLGELQRLNPTCIVAPPKILRLLAEQRADLGPTKIFSAAETLDTVDRQIIENYFGLDLGQIYMATEGLLGVSCRHGKLHLAEDSTFFEFEDAGNGLVSPLITCFKRKTQIMARYRMNDLLRLASEPCPCGSPLQVVDEVVGRVDDVFHLRSEGGPVLITPDVLRDAVLAADRQIVDFRVVQTAPDCIELVLCPDLPDKAAHAALAGLEQVLRKRNVQAIVRLVRTGLSVESGRKLRRVECRLERDNTA